MGNRSAKNELDVDHLQHLPKENKLPQPQPQPQTLKDVVPDHYDHGLHQEDEERLEKLFKSLDRDGNGRIDILDLSAALKDFGLCHTYAEVK